MLKALLDITTGQFNAYHAWCALRNLPEGEMTSHAGKSRDGHPVELKQIQVNERITESVDKREFVLFPRVTTPVAKQEKIRSAMIAPIINPSGCFGVLYVDNSTDAQSYGLSDLDYLMLIAIHTAAILENF
jgi:GAF domain-containing protein